MRADAGASLRARRRFAAADCWHSPIVIPEGRGAAILAGFGGRPALALLCLVLGACFGDPELRLPAVPSGDTEVELTASLQALHDAAASAPASGERRGELAMAYDVNGFHERAILVYGQAAALAPEEVHWPYFRALLMARINADHAGALAALADAIALDDSYVPAWLAQGEWLREVGRAEEARAAYERAAELGAGSPASHGLARLLMDDNRMAEAVKLLEPLSRQLADPRIDALLARAYRASGREEDARIAAARGSGATLSMQWIDPRLAKRTPYIAGFSNLLQHAQSMIQAGRQKEALEIAKSLVADRPDDMAAINTLVWANAALEQFAAAQAVLRDALRRYPDEPRLHQMMANAYLQQGDADSARHHLERVTQLDPDNARALEELGWLLARNGRADDGIALLERALDSGAREPKQVLYRLGLLLGAKERWAEAAVRFRDAGRINAAFTMAHVHLARCLAEAGDYDGARSALQWADRIGTHAPARASARRRIESLQEGEA